MSIDCYPFYIDGSVSFNARVSLSDAKLDLRILNVSQLDWIALGVSLTGEMKDSDIVLAYFLASNSTDIGQYWATGNQRPQREPQVYFSNAQLRPLNRTRNGLFLRFDRPIASSGPNSNPLIVEPGVETKFIYASGPVVRFPNGSTQFLMHRGVNGGFRVALVPYSPPIDSSSGKHVFTVLMLSLSILLSVIL